MDKMDAAPRFPWTYFAFAFGITWIIRLAGVLSTLELTGLPVPFGVFFFLGTWGRSWLLRG